MTGLLSSLFIFAKFNYQKFKRLALPIFGIVNILLLMVLLPGVGSSYGTRSHSWFNLAGISFQPAEIAKLALIIFLAYFLSKLGRGIENWRQGLFPVLGWGLIPVGLVFLQPDMGTMLILFAILFSLLFFGGAKFIHMGIMALVGIIAFLLMIWAMPYRVERFTVFLHPELDPQGKGYQTSQALLAVGSGGFFGVGLGHSRQKFQYLPEVQADSIFAIVAEEMGFLVSAGVIVLLVLIARRGFFLIKNTTDPFGRLLISGIISWFLVQSVLNIGAIIGVLPLTGVPLPFISHGGTSLMISMAAVGILINVSRETT